MKNHTVIKNSKVRRWKRNRFFQVLKFLLVVLIFIIHIGGAYILLTQLHSESTNGIKDFFSNASLAGDEFFKQLFRTGLFFYFTFFAAHYFGIRSPDYLKTTLGLFALSIAISTLLAADKSITKKLRGERPPFANTITPENSNSTTNSIGVPSQNSLLVNVDSTRANLNTRSRMDDSEEVPTSFSSMLFILLTQRHYLLILAVFTLIVISYFSYNLFRHIFKVEYTGSGIQIRVPGQTIYYMPIYPQISWQRTGIKLTQGDKYSVELSGYVSPGGVQNTSELSGHMKDFVDKVSDNESPEESYKKLKNLIWPYTGPYGYKRKWYGDNGKPILKKHRLYQNNYYFEEDNLLTVQGLPHNKVVGFIRKPGEPAPNKSDGKLHRPAFEWKKDKEQLINFSCTNYPMDLEVDRSGELYVVINDVDLARWDNTGLFFLKLTKNTI